MEAYRITITETLSRVVEIEAVSYNEAINEVSYMIDEEEIVLTADDFLARTIS